MKLVRFGNTDILSIGGKKTILGFLANFRIQTPNNTPYVAADLDLTIIQVKATLRTAKGESIVLFNDRIDLVAIDSAMRLNQQFKFLTARIKAGVQFQASGVGTPEILSIPLILYTGLINIQRGDTVDLQIQVPTNAGTTSVDAANSSVVLSEIYGTGLMLGYEIYESKAMQLNQTNWAQSYGDGIMSLSYINLDTNFAGTFATAVVDTLGLTAKNQYRNYQSQELYVMYDDPQPNSPGGNVFYSERNCFPIIRNSPKELPFENVELNLNLQGAAITANNNYVVSRKLVTTDDVISNNFTKEIQGEAETMRLTGLNNQTVQNLGR